jgi:hypothetical protein
MKKTIKLTESDLSRIVNRVINEGSSSVLFVTLGNEPTCWCKPSELM